MKKSIRQTIMDVLFGEGRYCVDGHHCPEAEAPVGLPIAEADITFDPAAGHDHDNVGSQQVDHANLGNVLAAQHHAHWDDVCYGPFLFEGMIGADIGSVANRAYIVPTYVKRECTVSQIGVGVGETVSGNCMFAVYDNAYNQLCVTAAILSTALTDDRVNWVTPATLPALTPGRHYLAAVCDTIYAAGVSGLEWRRSAFFSHFRDLMGAGVAAVQRQDAAYPLPDPFVPVVEDWSRTYGIVLKVTI